MLVLQEPRCTVDVGENVINGFCSYVLDDFFFLIANGCEYEFEDV